MDEMRDKLYLRMDNFWLENKKEYMITFLCVLVYLDNFKKV